MQRGQAVRTLRLLGVLCTPCDALQGSGRDEGKRGTVAPKRSGGLRGRLLEAGSGHPVSEYHVRLRFVQESGPGLGPAVPAASAGSALELDGGTGEFTVAALPPGLYEVEAYRADSASSFSAPLVVRIERCFDSVSSGEVDFDLTPPHEPRAR